MRLVHLLYDGASWVWFDQNKADQKLVFKDEPKDQPVFLTKSSIPIPMMEWVVRQNFNLDPVKTFSMNDWSRPV